MIIFRFLAAYPDQNIAQNSTFLSHLAASALETVSKLFVKASRH